MRKGGRDPRERLEGFLLLLGGGVFVVWAFTQVTAVMLNRPVDPAVHGIMLATVTGAFTFAGLISRGGGGKGDGDGKP